MSETVFKNYAALSDEQLVVLVKEGNGACFDILSERYRGIINKIADVYKETCSLSDLVYVGKVGLANAVMFYRSDRGASFKTFAYKCIELRMIDLVRKAASGKMLSPKKVLSLDDTDVSVADDPETLFIEKERINALISSIKSQLSDFEYRVFCDYAFGKSYKEIALNTGKSEKAVENALARVRRKIVKIKR